MHNCEPIYFIKSLGFQVDIKTYHNTSSSSKNEKLSNKLLLCIEECMRVFSMDILIILTF